LEIDIITVHIAQAKYTQRITYTQAKRTCKIAKNNKRIKASRMFLKYTNQSREDYNPYNLPNTITGEKDLEKESSNNKKEHEEMTILGHIYTRSQTRVSCYYTAAELIIKDDKEIKEIDLTGDLMEDIEEEPVYNSSDPENSNSKDKDFVD
jgi:hypothetical protein